MRISGEAYASKDLGDFPFDIVYLVCRSVDVKALFGKITAEFGDA